VTPVALPDVAAGRLAWCWCDAIEQLTQRVADELRATLGADDRIHPVEQIARQVQVRGDVVKRWPAHDGQGSRRRLTEVDVAQYHDEHENEYDLRVGDSDLRVMGVSRDAENAHCLVLSLTRRPTDDELRLLHDTLRPFRFEVPARKKYPSDEERARRRAGPLSPKLGPL
jgi:hypothetical protein